MVPFWSEKKQKKTKKKKQLNFTSKHDIEQIKIPPSHQGTNNVEATVMKPLLNTIKIAYMQNQYEVETLNSF